MGCACGKNDIPCVRKKQFERKEPPPEPAQEFGNATSSTQGVEKIDERREIDASSTGRLLVLSKRQKARLVRWRRMKDLGITEIFTREPSEATIRQGAVGDCSFLAAICVLAHNEDGRALLKSAIRETDDGIYEVRMYYEGKYVNIEIDDWVPTGQKNKLIVAYSEGEMWVTLLEKAFVTIMGGSYDVCGSNPNTDAYHITGWVPETLVLSEISSQDAEEAWNSLVYGKLIACLGTMKIGDVTHDKEWEEGVSVSTGLVEDHAYSILRVHQERKLLYVRNSWGKQRWNKEYGVNDPVWKDFFIEGYDIKVAQQKDDGCFWIPWPDVIRHFSHLYLLHNPKYLHKVCTLPNERFEPGNNSILVDDAHCTAWNPQYLVRGPVDTTIYVLLTRLSSKNPSFVTMHAWQRNTRGFTYGPPLRDGVYSAGQSVLLKVKTREFVAFVSQHQRKTPFDFSVDIFLEHNRKVTVERLPFCCPSVFCEWGRWSGSSAGGSTNEATYSQNPSYRLEITRKESIVIFLESTNEQLTLNLRLFHFNDTRPSGRTYLHSSGPYVVGCVALGPIELEVGIYRIIPSTYRPRDGDFRIDLRAQYSNMLADDTWNGKVSKSLRKPDPSYSCGLQSVIDNQPENSIIQVEVQ